MTLDAIAFELNAQGIATRDGAAWSPTTVRRVLIRLGLYPAPNTQPQLLKPHPARSWQRPSHHLGRGQPPPMLFTIGTSNRTPDEFSASWIGGR